METVKPRFESGSKSELDNAELCTIEGCGNRGTNTIAILMPDDPARSNTDINKSDEVQDSDNDDIDNIHFSVVCEKHFRELVSKYYDRTT